MTILPSAKLFLVLGLAMLVAACCDQANPYDDFTYGEEYILYGICNPDCSPDYLSFSSVSPHGKFEVNSLTVEVIPNEIHGFSYCVNYFDDQSCGDSDLNWTQIFEVQLTIPCNTHTAGLLIEARRGDPDELGNFPLPSYWIAYTGGTVTLLEAETAIDIQQVFNCSLG